MIGLGGFFAIYLGYLVGGAWVPGRRFDEFMAVFSYVLEHPFANYFNVNTPKCVVAVTFVYAIAITMYYTSQRNLMPGREFGTAKFANIKQVVQKLKDPDIGFNRILSQNVRMSLNTRLTKLNNNELDCVFATYQLLKEGVDVPNLRYIALATPEKDETTVIQSVGRVGRKADGKECGTVFDFVDDFAMYYSWYIKRQGYYRKINAEIY